MSAHLLAKWKQLLISVQLFIVKVFPEWACSSKHRAGKHKPIDVISISGYPGENDNGLCTRLTILQLDLCLCPSCTIVYICHYRPYAMKTDKYEAVNLKHEKWMTPTIIKKLCFDSSYNSHMSKCGTMLDEENRWKVEEKGNWILSLLQWQSYCSSTSNNGKYCMTLTKQ
jgi:hypothetical protein